MAVRKQQAITRHDKDEWLKKALEVVARDGGAKLRIDALVKEMGVTKGSFYWHFESRDDFVRALLEYWHEYSTLNVPRGLQELSGSASERLYALITIVVGQELTRYDLAIRSWAIQEPDIRPLVRRTDVFRLNFVRDLFAEMGFDTTEADMRARMLVTYMALDGAVFDKLPKKKRVDYIQRIHKMVTWKN
jgi:AcrR family transcriptional regulator